jgi:hypothetical protein
LGGAPQRGDWRRIAKERSRRLVRQAKYLLGGEPWLLPVYLRITPLGTSRQITSRTQLVLEGFPRCGNTFTAFALQDASLDRVRIASHVHVPAQVKRAVSLGLPTVLQVREPLGALASYVAYDPSCTTSDALREYIHYHRQLVPFADNLLVIDFDQTTADMNAVIDRINDAFGLGIGPFDHSEANVARIFDRIDQRHRVVHRRRDPDVGVPRPSPARADVLEQHKTELLAPRNAKLLAQARDLYNLFAAMSTRPGQRKVPDGGASPVSDSRPGADTMSDASSAKADSGSGQSGSGQSGNGSSQVGKVRPLRRRLPPAV